MIGPEKLHLLLPEVRWLGRNHIGQYEGGKLAGVAGWGRGYGGINLFDPCEVLLVKIGDEDDKVRKLERADGTEVGVTGARINQQDLKAKIVSEGVGDFVEERQSHAFLRLEETGPVDGSKAARVVVVELAGKQERKPAAGLGKGSRQCKRNEGVNEAFIRENVVSVEKLAN